MKETRHGRFRKVPLAPGRPRNGGGIALGAVAPGLVSPIAATELARVDLVAGLLIRAMVYPMMIGVEPAALKGALKAPKGLVVTLGVNWLIKPFTMAALAVLFFKGIIADLIAPRGCAAIRRRADPAGRGSLHRDGLRLVAADERG